ncbi:MAG TPA: ATP-binding cassette domain-containing protein, partial [Nordella sp.]|nr:ATP-binding cassette domain-containing protein [Nordella sp.]
MASVDISGIAKNYGPVRVLKGVDIAIADGEFIVLVGPSGCGKSTLLRMIAGLEEVSEGTISIDGTIVNEVEPKDRDIAMVFQSYALYPQMKVKDNMSFSLRMRGFDKPKIKQEVDAAAGILALDSLLERFPRQ